MYYRGISEGVTPKKVNILKLAQSIMEKRCAVANDLSKIISEMAVYSRPYYKLIKVRGVSSDNSSYSQVTYSNKRIMEDLISSIERSQTSKSSILMSKIRK